MTSENPTPSMQERMDDLKETLKKEKVKLTPEVEQYIQDCLRAVQNKLQNGEDVYEEDLAFIDEVKMWVEATKRYLSSKQWLDVLHVAKAAGKSREWIDETLTFPGGGKIEVEEDLNLENYTGLTTLPEGLKVGRSLKLKGCTGLTNLPEGLKVGEYLSLEKCTGLTSLPEGIKIRGNLYLIGCTGLTTLPKGLEVGGSLILSGCTGLTTLPEGLKVGEDLFLSEDLHEQVKKDAERLKEEGRIGGEIEYY